MGMRSRKKILDLALVGILFLSYSAYAEGLTDWNIISYMNEYRETCGAAVIQGYMYAIGGLYPSNDSVEQAKINSDGSLGTWQYVNKVITSGRSAFATVTANNSIYIIGGYSYVSSGWGLPVVIGSIERATVNSDGSLSSWSTLSSNLVIPRYAFACIVANNRIYAIGGGTDISPGWAKSVEQADINPDGTLGPFTLSTTQLTDYSEGLSAIVYQNYIITAGGDNIPSFPSPTQVAQIYPDGQLGAWVAINVTLYHHVGAVAVTDNQYIYIVGDANPVERALLYSNGSVGDWESLNDLNIWRRGLGGVLYFPYIYAIDGYNDPLGDQNSVERAMIIPTSVEKKYWELLE